MEGVNFYENSCAYCDYTGRKRKMGKGKRNAREITVMLRGVRMWRESVKKRIVWA